MEPGEDINAEIDDSVSHFYIKETKFTTHKS